MVAFVSISADLVDNFGVSNCSYCGLNRGDSKKSSLEA